MPADRVHGTMMGGGDGQVGRGGGGGTEIDDVYVAIVSTDGEALGAWV